MRFSGYSSLSVERRKSSRNRKTGLFQAIAMPSSTITPLVGRTAVHHREDAVGIADIAEIRLADPVGPAGLRPVDLVVAGEGLPDLRPECFERPDQFRERPGPLLSGEPVGIREVESFQDAVSDSGGVRNPFSPKYWS